MFWDWKDIPVQCDHVAVGVQTVSRLLILLIRGYQRFAPTSLRDRCIFHERCSNYVMRTVKERGFRAGLRAFAERTRKCRPGYIIIELSGNAPTLVRLADGSTVLANELIERRCDGAV